MRIPIFELERVQSLYENTVPCNLTESGFHPLSLEEVLDESERAALMSLSLGYGQTNGALDLRERIAALYPGQSAENVLVTNGSSEANYVVCHTLIEPDDEVVVMLPNYMQIWGTVLEIGATVKSFPLVESEGWAPDLDALRAAVSKKTKMIAVCNPSNPTGYVLSDAEMKEIVAIAESVGAWIHADEVYRGAELDGIEATSFAGLYDKVTVSGGLSKAYALPGLRVGWVVAPEAIANDAWAYHDYTSITAGRLSHEVGRIALTEPKRTAILERNRAMLRENLRVTEEWVAAHGDTFRFVPPKAGGMAFMRYGFDIGSTELADWLRLEHGVFILAGDVYGMDRYFRLGIGAETGQLVEGFETLRRAFAERFTAP